MYNGIGLSTPRGSGTNGYVQRNLANVYKPKDKDDFRKPSELGAPAIRKPNSDIIEHDKKRKVELKCLEFQQMLEDQGYNENEVFKRVSTYRQIILESVPDTNMQGRVATKETHEIAEAQQRKNEKLRQAFGISNSFIDGSSFDPERRAKEAAARAALVEAEKYALIPSPSSSDGESDIASVHAKKRTRKLNSPSIETRKKTKKKKHKRKRSSSKTAEETNYTTCAQPEKYLSTEVTKRAQASRTSTHPDIAPAIEKRKCEKNSSVGCTLEIAPKEMARKQHSSSVNYFSVEDTSVEKYYRRSRVDRVRDDRIPNENSYSDVKGLHESEAQVWYTKMISNWKKAEERSSPLDDGSPSSWTKRSRYSRTDRGVDLRDLSPTQKRGEKCQDGKMRSTGRREYKSRRRSLSKTPSTTKGYSQLGMNMRDKTFKSIPSKITVRHSPGKRFTSHEWTYERESGCDRESVTSAKHGAKEKELPKHLDTTKTSKARLTLGGKRGDRSPHSEQDTSSPLRSSSVKANEKGRPSSVRRTKVERSNSTIKADYCVSPVHDKSSPLRYSPAERYSDRYSDVLAVTSNNHLERQEFLKTPAAWSLGASRADEERLKTPISFHELPKTGNYSSGGRINSDDKDKSQNSIQLSSSADFTSHMIDEAVKKTASALEMDREKTLESLRKLLSSSIDNSKRMKNKEKNGIDKEKIKRKRKKNKNKNNELNPHCLSPSSSCFGQNKKAKSKSSDLSSLSSSSDSSLSSRSHITSSSTSESSGSSNRSSSTTSNSSTTSCSSITSSNSTGSGRSNNGSSSSCSSPTGQNSSNSTSRSSSSGRNNISSRHSSNSSSISRSDNGSGSRSITTITNNNNKGNIHTKLASRKRRKHRVCSRSNSPTAHRCEHSASHHSPNPCRSHFRRSGSVSKNRKAKNKYHKGQRKRRSDSESSSKSLPSNNRKD